MWGHRRQHARVQYFVDILRQHGDDENKKSLLRRVGISLRCTQPLDHISFWKCVNRGVFILEPLAALTGIEEVIIGSDPRLDWFMQCLSLRMRGEGGELKKLEWPTKTTRRLRLRDKGKRPRKTTVSTWKPGIPTLDWFDFARRNGIEIPADTEIELPEDYVGGQ